MTIIPIRNITTVMCARVLISLKTVFIFHYFLFIYLLHSMHACPYQVPCFVCEVIQKFKLPNAYFSMCPTFYCDGLAMHAIYRRHFSIFAVLFAVEP